MQHSNTSYFSDLLDLLNKQEETIETQNKMIAKLVNENLEQENMINVLMNEFKAD